MSRTTVLIVEDSPDTLNAVRLLLEQEGFKVITAKEGLTAIEYLTLYQPNVIVTDLMLPEMTGLELIRQIRRAAMYDSIIIVAMTAYDQTYLAAAVLAGANAALHKPEGIEVIVETIKELLVEAEVKDVA